MSVPSIFSQLYEQAEAFSIINYNPIIESASRKEAEQLVSHCLDLFELILMHNLYCATHINIGDIQSLSQSQNCSHQLLASVIEEDLQYLDFKNISGLYVFEGSGFVLGGTSPMTLVYTSPNIAIEFKQRDMEIRGFCGNILFRDIVPLHRRGKQFKDFMYGYKESFALPTLLQDYISRSMQIDNVVLPPAPIAYDSKYENLSDSNGNPISVNGIPILCISFKKSIEDCDYLLSPQKNVNTPLPLVLSDCGLCGAKYIFEMQWEPRSLPTHFYVPIEDRLLPGTNIIYPYVSIDDFLEHKIIQLPYITDTQHFFAYNCGESSYLPPIKRLYFKYFTVEDLWNNLSFETDGSNEFVKVKLRVPVRGGTIEFQREYHKDSVAKVNINIAITPFYYLAYWSKWVVKSL